MTTPLTRAYARADGFVGSRAAGLILIVLALVTSVITIVTATRQHHLAECQAEYNVRFAEALRARQAATDSDRDALDAMIFTVTTAKDRDTVRNALDTYVSTRRRADAYRAAHPLPEPVPTNATPAGGCR